MVDDDVLTTPLNSPKTPFTSDNAERVAHALSHGRRVHRSGSGLKTFCPSCQSENKRRTPRRTLSITARDGIPLVHCHRCKSDGRDIIRKLVDLGLLPNLFRESSAALAVVDRVRAAVRDATWSGTGKATDRLVLFALIEIVDRCRKVEFGVSIRDAALRAHVKEATAWRSLRRLARSGWIKKMEPARGQRAAIWRLCVPQAREDQTATLPHARREGNRLFQFDPFFSEADRAGWARLVARVPHDAFRWGKGLGAVKGWIYFLLARPLKPSEIASILRFKHVRNVRIHLRRLIEHRLVLRRSDGRYERGDADLDAVAMRLGVFGATEKQCARYLEERSAFNRWHELFERWKGLGEIIDPETGVVLESGFRSNKRASMADFRRAVLSGRMRALMNSQATQHEPISLVGAPDPALAAAVAMIEKTFPGARLVELSYARRGGAGLLHPRAIPSAC